jgi:hypothetical protein
MAATERSAKLTTAFRVRTQGFDGKMSGAIFSYFWGTTDCSCGPVARVPGYRSRDPDSIPGATRFSEK